METLLDFFLRPFISLRQPDRFLPFMSESKSPFFFLVLFLSRHILLFLRKSWRIAKNRKGFYVPFIQPNPSLSHGSLRCDSSHSVLIPRCNTMNISNVSMLCFVQKRTHSYFPSEADILFSPLQNSRLKETKTFSLSVEQTLLLPHTFISKSCMQKK